MTDMLDVARRKLFSQGSTTVFSSRADARFPYCLYVPPTDTAKGPPGLTVAVHGTGRNFMQYRDQFAEFGAQHNQVILAPLFSAGLLGDGNVDGYKYLIEGELRYDQILLSIVDEVAEMTGCQKERFAIFGYSGGGHFVHRFLLVHPDRISAASIGAPGQVTLLDLTSDWWIGVKDLETLFGHRINLHALRRVAVQMVVGTADTETWEIIHAPSSRYWREEAARAGDNRFERLQSMRKSFEAQGISVEFATMEGIKHESGPAIVLAQGFFARSLAA